MRGLLDTSLLRAAAATYAALPIDEAVASHFAELVSTARRAASGRSSRTLWIAATACRHRVPVYTQDGDFEALSVKAIRV